MHSATSATLVGAWPRSTAQSSPTASYPRPVAPRRSVELTVVAPHLAWMDARSLALDALAVPRRAVHLALAFGTHVASSGLVWTHFRMPLVQASSSLRRAERKPMPPFSIAC